MRVTHAYKFKVCLQNDVQCTPTQQGPNPNRDPTPQGLLAHHGPWSPVRDPTFSGTPPSGTPPTRDPVTSRLYPIINRLLSIVETISSWALTSFQGQGPHPQGPCPQGPHPSVTPDPTLYSLCRRAAGAGLSRRSGLSRSPHTSGSVHKSGSVKHKHNTTVRDTCVSTNHLTTDEDQDFE